MVMPVGKTRWEIDFIQGQEDPEIQGWYSPEYNQFGHNVASIYSTEIKGDETFVWLLVPFDAEAPKLKAKLISKDVEWHKPPYFR
jgi:hypothetical protein